MLSMHSVGTYQGNELLCNSSGNVCPQSSQLAAPLWTDPGLKIEIAERELISIQRERERERERSNLPAKSSHVTKIPLPPLLFTFFILYLLPFIVHAEFIFHSVVIAHSTVSVHSFFVHCLCLSAVGTCSFRSHRSFCIVRSFCRHRSF